MRVSLLLLSLFLLSSLSFAENGILQLVLPATVMIVVIVLAILWMISDTLNMPQMRAWVKIEIRELIVAAILLAVIYSAFFIQKSVVGLISGQGEGYIDVAKNSLNSILEIHKSAFNDLIIISSKITSLSGYGYNYPIPVWFFSFSYTRSSFAGASAILSPVTVAAQGEAGALFIYKSMSVFLTFFDSTIFSIILPLGFILRIIPFSRQLGTTVIALSLGAVVIYPFSLIIMKNAHSLPGFNLPHPQLSAESIDTLTVTIPAPMKQFCELAFARYFIGFSELGWSLLICPIYAAACSVGYAACFSACWTMINTIIYPIVVLAFQIVMGSAILITDLATSKSPDTIFNIVNTFLRDVNNLVVLSYIDVIVVAIITIIGVKSISTALGGESYLVGIQRLV